MILFFRDLQKGIYWKMLRICLRVKVYWRVMTKRINHPMKTHAPGRFLETEDLMHAHHTEIHSDTDRHPAQDRALVVLCVAQVDIDPLAPLDLVLGHHLARVRVLGHHASEAGAIDPHLLRALDHVVGHAPDHFPRAAPGEGTILLQVHVLVQRCGRCA